MSKMVNFSSLKNVFFKTPTSISRQCLLQNNKMMESRSCLFAEVRRRFICSAVNCLDYLESAPVAYKDMCVAERQMQANFNLPCKFAHDVGLVINYQMNKTGSLLAATLPRIVVTPPVVTVAANNGAVTGTALPMKMECLGSYSSVVGGKSLPAPPMLTPSLNYVRSDHTSHVTGGSADILEEQACEFNKEAYQSGCLCRMVSADLKCARALVRHTEIQATIKEQKIMYLRQQISRLEELKSQNSFMSED